MLKKVYAKIGVLKRPMPHNMSLSLYKAYLLPHFEYLSPLLIGINKTLSSKLESANKYALKTLLNLGNNLDYDTILSLSDMQSLESRRYYSSRFIIQMHALLWSTIHQELFSDSSYKI